MQFFNTPRSGVFFKTMKDPTLFSAYLTGKLTPDIMPKATSSLEVK
jgi:hypothetical protein